MNVSQAITLCLASLTIGMATYVCACVLNDTTRELFSRQFYSYLCVFLVMVVFGSNLLSWKTWKHTFGVMILIKIVNNLKQLHYIKMFLKTPFKLGFYFALKADCCWFCHSLFVLSDSVAAINPKEGCPEHDGDSDDAHGRDHVTVDDAGEEECDHLTKRHDNDEDDWTCQIIYGF